MHAAKCTEHGHGPAYQVGRKRRQPIVLPPCKSVFDCDVAAIVESGGIQSLTESSMRRA
jgi:hypothetical protein